MSRIRRSALFTPADDDGMMRTAASTEADALVFDLEDAVPTDRLPTARENLRALVPEVDADVEVGVRINGVGTDGWFDDVIAATDAGVDAVLVPKVESPSELRTIVDVLAASTDTVPTVRFAVETPSGLLAARRIADRTGSVSPVAGISFGLADYCRALGAPEPTPRLREAVSFRVSSIAAAYGLEAYASTYLAIDDEDGLRHAAVTSRSTGFDGMSAIHPNQIPIINEVFTPDPGDVRRSRRLIEAYESADSDSIRVDGTFLDEATVAHHRTVVDRYEDFHDDDHPSG